jgi:hypothetical protein
LYKIAVSNDGKIVANMDAGNGLLSYKTSLSGRWVGLSTACCYSKSTEYYIYDLKTATDESTDDDGYICVGGNLHGWFTHKVAYNFVVDLEQEIVTWTDGTILNFERMIDGEDHFG